MLTVGFIGIGQMGCPMAKNLLNEGIPVVVYDIDKEKIRNLTMFGAKAATGPKELATESDIVLTILDYPNVVETAIVGEGGVLEGLRTESILMECSSIDHETSIRLAGAVTVKGGKFVEAALLGRPHSVESKQLVFLAAGDEKTVKECNWLFNTIGRKVLYVGSFGTAKLLKIVNAMANAIEIGMLCEVAAWSKRNQISNEGLLEVLQHRSNESSSRVKQLAGCIQGHLQKQRTWMNKDVEFGLKIADDRNIVMPLLSRINTIIDLAKSSNLDDYAFFDMIWKFYDEALPDLDFELSRRTK